MTITATMIQSLTLKGIVHFEIIFWYVLAYLKGIQDVGVFVGFLCAHSLRWWP